MSDDLSILRARRDSEALERYEASLLETAAYLKLFRQHHGHEPASVQALRVWVQGSVHGPIDPHEVLTREEIAQLWEDAEY